MKQKINLRKLALLALSFILIFSSVPFSAYAAEGTTEVSYLDGDTVKTHEVSEMQSNMKDGWYAAINKELSFDTRIVIQGDVNLIIGDGTNTICKEGIYITENSKLTIWAQSAADSSQVGKLTCSPLSGPGIGGTEDLRGGTLVINGGKIYAYAGDWSAGIGGGSRTDMQSVIINDGYVEAKGYGGGAGIGGGWHGDFEGTVTINGGTVKATGSEHQANNNSCGAGIGGGFGGNAQGGSITINGGTVTAVSQGWAAGIGGGEELMVQYNGGEGSNVYINGGTVYASSDLCAIGHGGTDVGIDHTDSVMGTLNIADGLRVFAGNDGIDNVEPFTFDSREGACQYRKYAKIEPCKHPYADDFIFIDCTEETHTIACKHCRYILSVEKHKFDTHGYCTVCGTSGKKYKVTYRANNGNTDDDKTLELIGPAFYTIPEYEAQPPEGMGFLKWLLLKGNNELYYTPGQLYRVIEDTTFSAVFYTLPRVNVEHQYSDLDYFPDGDYEVVVPDKSFGEEGTVVNLSVKNTDLYRLHSIKAEDKDNNPVEIKPDQEQTDLFSITMPETDVNVTYDLEFGITTNSHDNGYVAVDGGKVFAEEGETVTFKTLPDGDSCLGDLEVLVKDKYGYGKNVTVDVTRIGDDQYSFIMPRYPVQIDAYFKLKEFDVTFKDYDGMVLSTHKIKYGQTPIVDDPVRDNTEYIEYEFDGWYDEEGNKLTTSTEITKDTVYTARYNEKNIQYTVNFVYDDGTTVISSHKVDAGTKLSEVGLPENVTREDTAEYHFSEKPEKWVPAWDPDKKVFTDLTYMAVFSREKRSYMIYFNDPYGSQLYKEEFEYGEMPVYGGNTPTMPSTAEGKEYVFAGWAPKLDYVEGEMSYYAKFLETDASYVIKWLNDDGTVIYTANDGNSVPYSEIGNYEYGGSVTPLKSNPDPGYTYTFTGWVMTISDDNASIAYVPQFERALKKNIPITFQDENGDVLLETKTYDYGTPAASIDVPADPSKPETAEYTYRFKGWSPALSTVTEETVYKATYSGTKRFYTVTFKNEDGTVLGSSEIAYGRTPSYEETPTKEADAEYTYTFKEWTPTIDKVTGDQVYIAVYDKTVNEYNVTFYDEDGKTVLYSSKFPYGSIPVYEGKTPTKAESEEYTYTFSDWTPKLEKVTGDKSYRATYKGTKKEAEEDPKEDTAVSYFLASGGNATWLKGSSEGLVFTFKRSVDDSETFSHFTGISINGVDIAAANYDASAGSVVISLHASYLERLAPGRYNLTALFDDGDGDIATFTVKTPTPNSDSDDKTPTEPSKPNRSDSGSPETGDNSQMILWTVLLIIAGGTIATALLRRKKTE